MARTSCGAAKIGARVAEIAVLAYGKVHTKIGGFSQPG